MILLRANSKVQILLEGGHLVTTIKPYRVFVQYYPDYKVFYLIVFYINAIASYIKTNTKVYKLTQV
jgi:hypothetical protein